MCSLTRIVVVVVVVARDVQMLAGNDQCALMMKSIKKQLEDANVLVTETLESALNGLRESFTGWVAKTEETGAVVYVNSTTGERSATCLVPPKGWVVQTDPANGRPIYENPTTGESSESWRAPLVAGWVAQKDPEAEDTVYVNETTNERSATRPAELPADWVTQKDRRGRPVKNANGRLVYKNPTTGAISNSWPVPLAAGWEAQRDPVAPIAAEGWLAQSEPATDAVVYVNTTTGEISEIRPAALPVGWVAQMDRGQPATVYATRLEFSLGQLRKSFDNELKPKLEPMRREARKAGRTTWEALERSVNSGAAETEVNDEAQIIKNGIAVMKRVTDQLDKIVESSHDTLNASERLKGKLQSMLKVRYPDATHARQCARYHFAHADGMASRGRRSTHLTNEPSPRLSHLGVRRTAGRRPHANASANDLRVEAAGRQGQGQRQH